MFLSTYTQGVAICSTSVRENKNFSNEYCIVQLLYTVIFNIVCMISTSIQLGGGGWQIVTCTSYLQKKTIIFKHLIKFERRKKTWEKQTDMVLNSNEYVDYFLRAVLTFRCVLLTAKMLSNMLNKNPWQIKKKKKFILWLIDTEESLDT